MPLNLIFITPGNYTIDDNGTPGDNISVIRDGTGAVIFTFAHPADSLGFTASTPGVNLTVNFTDTLGAANFTIGDLTSSAATPDSVTIGNVRTTGIVTLVSNGAIAELGGDAGSDIVAGQLILSAGTGVGSGANAIETQTPFIEAETVTGGINIRNFGSVQIGGSSDNVSGLHVQTSGDINLWTAGSIFLSDATGPETIHGGSSSGNVTLTAAGLASDIIANVNRDSIAAPGGNVVLSAGRDIAFGTIGADFDNDVRARGSITIDAGRDFLVDGFSDIASDGFGANTGGNLVVNAGRNIHVRNIAGTDASMGAEGSAGADVILTTGLDGALILDAPFSAAVFSSSGDVIANADRALIAATSGITANSGQVFLRPATAGREIVLGSAGDAAFALELSDAELDRLFTPTLNIGDDNSGQITVSSALSPANATDMVLRSGGDIAIQAAITTIGDLELRAGDNLVLSASPTFTVGGTLSIFVDTLGNDGGVGGIVDLSTATINAGAILVDGAEENDTLTGAEGVDQTVHGNGGNDRLISSGEGQYFGDAGNDTILAGLSGGAVPEILDGGGGVDTLDTRSFTGDYVINLATGVTNFAYESFAGFENVILGDGTNTVTGTAGANQMTGGTGTDVLQGGGGDDTLDGGGGDDHLRGGLGADQHIGGAGIDLARYDDGTYGDLTIRLDNPALNVGAAAVGDTYSGIEGLMGGGGSDTIIGDGADYLNGGDGDDHLRGGLGADQHIGGAGFDLARYDEGNYGDLGIRLGNSALNVGAAAVGDTYSGIEGVVGGSGNDMIVGDVADNVLLGLGGNDRLYGGLGNDRLSGGLGNDLFVFDTALNAATNVDTITDFSVPNDTIRLEDAIFTAIGPLGTLAAAAFTIGTVATTAAHRIIYNSATGALIYDSNGSAAGGATQFATLATGLALTNADFVVA